MLLPVLRAAIHGVKLAAPAFEAAYRVRLKPLLGGAKLSDVAEEKLPDVVLDKSGPDDASRLTLQKVLCEGGQCPILHVPEHKAADGDNRKYCLHWLRGHWAGVTSTTQRQRLG